MDGKQCGGRLLRNCSRAERPWRGDVGVEGSDITNAMIVLGRGGMGRDQMISKKWWVSFM